MSSLLILILLGVSPVCSSLIPASETNKCTHPVLSLRTRLSTRLRGGSSFDAHELSDANLFQSIDGAVAHVEGENYDATSDATASGSSPVAATVEAPPVPEYLQSAQAGVAAAAPAPPQAQPAQVQPQAQSSQTHGNALQSSPMGNESMEAAPAAKGRLNGNGSGSSSGGSSSSTAPSASAPATAAAEVPATAESNERSSFVRFDFLSNFFREIFRHVIHDEDVMDAVVKLSTWAVWFAVLLSVIGTLGVDTKPLLSLLGITGITLGVALKDQISELMSGLGLALFKPLGRGSLVTIYLGDRPYSGRVAQQTLRHVRLFDAVDNSHIILPVSAIARVPLRVHSAAGQPPPAAALAAAAAKAAADAKAKEQRKLRKRRLLKKKLELSQLLKKQKKLHQQQQQQQKDRPHNQPQQHNHQQHHQHQNHHQRNAGGDGADAA